MTFKVRTKSSKKHLLRTLNVILSRYIWSRQKRLSCIACIVVSRIVCINEISRGAYFNVAECIKTTMKWDVWN